MMHLIDSASVATVPEVILRAIKQLDKYEIWLQNLNEVEDINKNSTTVWHADSLQDFEEFFTKEGLQTSHPAHDKNSGKIWLMAQGDSEREPESLLVLPAYTRVQKSIFAFVELTDYQYKVMKERIQETKRKQRNEQDNIYERRAKRFV